MSAKLSALICGATEQQIDAFGKFAGIPSPLYSQTRTETIGIAFQIQDDLLNIEEVSDLSALKGTICDRIRF